MNMASDFESDAAFRVGVAVALDTLLGQIDDIESDEHDPQISEGNLKTVFESGGTYILSQQTPMHEIWLSAELQAWHFRRVDGKWAERDSDAAMADVLSRLFSDKLGLTVRFEL
jgi:iron donor protein CyaY